VGDGRCDPFRLPQESGEGGSVLDVGLGDHGGDQHACAVDEDAAMFLAALVSFYHSDPGGELLRSLGANGLSGIAARLDESRRQVIADLLLAYPGW